MQIEDYQELALSIVGSKFDDPDLLITAFTHRSYLNEHRKTVKQHNERLEFLGDAVLELIVTEYLYKNFDHPEGILTNWRAALVRTESISQAADKLGLGAYLRLSRGEKQGSARAREQILANVFESVIGAIYLDKGYESAKAFIAKNIIVTLEDILETGAWRDAKSRLQEVAQSEEGVTPSYKVIGEDGPDHEKIFKIGVFIEEEMRGLGEGPSKQIAQQQAAQKALRYYERRKKPTVDTPRGSEVE